MLKIIFVVLTVLNFVLPAFAADISVHEITTAASQKISSPREHAQQYRLRLSSQLWQMEQDKPVILSDGGKDLVAIYRRENSTSLVVQVLPHMDAQPIHVNIYGADDKRYGPLHIFSNGSVSIFSGRYSSLHAEAKSIYLDKDSRAKEARLHVHGKFILRSNEAIIQRAPVKTYGTNFIQSRWISLNAKFFSSEQNFIQASLLEINKTSTIFSTLEAQLLADNLVVQGTINAPTVNLVIADKSQWQKSSVHAHVMALLADKMVFKDAEFNLKSGFWAKGTEASGLAHFKIGGHQNWHFSEFSKHLQKFKMQGCFLDVRSTMFNEKTKFEIDNGAMSIKSKHAKIGDIIAGKFNRYPVELDVSQYVTLEGLLSAFDVQIKSLRASIPGKLFATTLRSNVDDLGINGIVSTTAMSADGSKLSIGIAGKVTTRELSFTENEVQVAGLLSAENTNGISSKLNITKDGAAGLNNARLHLDRTAVDGKLASKNLDIAGNEFALSNSGEFSAQVVNNHLSTWSLNGTGTINLLKSDTSLAVTSSTSFPIREANINADACAFTGTKIGFAKIEGDACALTGGSVDLARVNMHACTITNVDIDRAKINADGCRISSCANMGDVDIHAHECEIVRSDIDVVGIKADACEVTDSSIGVARVEAIECDVNNSALERAKINADRCRIAGSHLSYADIDARRCDVIGGRLDNAHIKGDSCALSYGSFGNAKLTTKQCELSDVAIKQATIDTGLFRISGSSTIDAAWIKAVQCDITDRLTMQYGNINARNLSMAGYVSIADALLHGLQWTLAHGGVLYGKINVDVQDASLHGHVSGKNFAGHVENLSIASSGSVHSDFVQIAGERFNNQGSVYGASELALDYGWYTSMGALNTAGQLAMKVNDRKVDDKFLKIMARDFGFSVLCIDTNQEIIFENNFYFPRGLSLSASRITLRDGPNPEKMAYIRQALGLPQHRSNFYVAGPLQLNSRQQLSINSVNVRAENLAAHTDETMRVHNSDIITLGDQFMSADEGFVFSPLVTDHYSQESKSTHWGFGEKTYYRHWQELVRSAAISQNGGIYFRSKNGGARFMSTTLMAADGVFAETKGDIVNVELKLKDDIAVKKSRPFGYSHQEISREYDAPTYVVGGNFAFMRSVEGRVHMPDTIFLSGHVKLRARETVHLSAPSLDTRVETESIGLSYSNFVTQLVDDPVRALMNCNPITSAGMGMHDACKTGNGVNMASAAVMAGIQIYNAADMLNKIVANLGGQISLNTSSTSFHKTSKGQGGIYATKIELISDLGDVEVLNGFELVCERGLVDCQNGYYIRCGFKEVTEHDASSASFGVSLAAVSGSVNTSSYERVEYLKQRLEGEFEVKARGEICLDKPVYERKENCGFGFSAGPMGGSVQVASNGDSFGVAYAAPNEKTGVGYLGVSVNGTCVAIPIVTKMEAPAPQVAKDAPMMESEPRQRNVVVADNKETPRIVREAIKTKRGVQSNADVKPPREEIPSYVDSEAPEMDMRRLVGVENFPGPERDDPAPAYESPREPTWSQTTLLRFMELQEEKCEYEEHIKQGVINTGVNAYDAAVHTAQKLADVVVTMAASKAKSDCLHFGSDEKICRMIDESPMVQASQNSMQESLDNVAYAAHLGKNISIVYLDALHRSQLAEVFGMETALAHPESEMYRQATKELIATGNSVANGVNSILALSGPKKVELLTEGVMTLPLSMASKAAGEKFLARAFSLTHKDVGKPKLVPFVKDQQAGIWDIDEFTINKNLTLTNAYLDGKHMSTRKLMRYEAKDDLHWDYLSDAGENRLEVMRMKQEKGAPYLIKGHGNKTYMVEKRIDIDNHGANISVSEEVIQLDEIVERMKKRGYSNGQSIVVASCNTGVELSKHHSILHPDKFVYLEENFAQALANKVQASVTAPNGPLYSHLGENNYYIIKEEFYQLTKDVEDIAENFSAAQRRFAAVVYYDERAARLAEAKTAFLKSNNHQLAEATNEMRKLVEKKAEEIARGAAISVHELRELYADPSPFYGEFKTYHPVSPLDQDPGIFDALKNRKDKK